MSNLNEPDVDTFFLAGDEGTYEGGPATSLAPIERVDVADDLPVVPTLAQLERRERLRRVVTTVVGTLGVASLLVFSFRLGKVTNEMDTDSAHASAATVAPAPAPPQAPEPVVAVVPIAVPEIAPPSSEVVKVAPVTAVATDKPGSSTGTSAVVATRTKRQPEAARASVVTRVPSAVVVPETAREHLTPPKASFPD